MGRRTRIRWRLRTVAGLLTLLCMLTVLPATAAPAKPPTIALRAEQSSVTLYEFGNRVRLDLGAYMVAKGGDFEIHARRGRYDEPVTAVQVDSATRKVLREIPADRLAGWKGLRSFFRVRVHDRQGNLVAAKRFTWCPNAWDRQRVDDTGPSQPRYPELCHGGLPFEAGFPFLKGMVWGIESGWAADAFGGSFWDSAPTIKNVPPGRYVVTLEVAPSWAKLFRIPKADRQVQFRAQVVPAPFEEDDHWDEPVVDDTARAMGDEDGPVAAMATRAAQVPSSTVPTLRNPPRSVMPDLVAAPAWNIRVAHRRGRDLLRFAATPWNAGPAPFVVEGFRRPGEDVMDAFQYFYDRDGKVVGRAPVGKFRYHAGRGHDHWHFLQFVQFDLLDASKQQVVKSRKQGFCLVPTDAVDLTVRRADLRPWSGIGTACGGPKALWVREVLQAGWGDTYDQQVAGQAFNVTDLPNGTYYLRVLVNPRGKVHQVRDDNDAVLRRIRLGGTPGARTVRVSAYQGIAG